MSEKQKLAYDMTRYRLLVQMLAINEDEEVLQGALHYFYIAWGVGTSINWNETTTLEVVQALARHIMIEN